MARSGISNDLWRGHSVELAVKSGPIISGLPSSKIASALAWELNNRNQIKVPFAAIQYGLLNSYFQINDRSEILEAIKTYLDSDNYLSKIA